jgi:polyferredoxin
MSWAWVTRSAVEISLIEDRNPLFVRLSDGGIRNGYTLKILNKTHGRQSFAVRVEGIDGPELSIVGHERGDAAIDVEAGVVRAVKVYVTVPAQFKSRLAGSTTPLHVVVTDAATDEEMVRDTAFRSPGP